MTPSLSLATPTIELMAKTAIKKTLEEFKSRGPAYWTKGAAAKDKSGKCVDIMDSGAVCFCTYGLVKKLVLESPPALFSGMRSSVIWYACALIAEGKGEGIGQWNDAPDTTFETIISRLEEITAEK